MSIPHPAAKFWIIDRTRSVQAFGMEIAEGDLTSSATVSCNGARGIGNAPQWLNALLL
jgi:hypothetical protein